MRHVHKPSLSGIIRDPGREASHRLAAPVSAQELEELAGLARLRGDHGRAAELEAAALRKSEQLRWSREIEQVRAWTPASADPSLSAQQRRDLESFIAEAVRSAVSESVVSARSKTDSDTRPPSERCGVWRFGRWDGSGTRLYHARCHRRSCPDCKPVVIERKLDAVPDRDDLVAVEITRDSWPTLERRLRRHRAAGKAGDYVRIPRPGQLLLIVTDDPELGRPISREAVERLMLEAEPRDGAITASASWRGRLRGEAPEGFVDEGKATARPEWVQEIAVRKLGLSPSWSRDGSCLDFGLTTEAEHRRLWFVAQVVQDNGGLTDAQYRAIKEAQAQAPPAPAVADQLRLDRRVA